MLDLSADGNDETYGVPDGAGGAGAFGASGERVGWVPSVGATQRFMRANEGEAVVRLGSGNTRTEISRTIQAMDQRGTANLPHNIEDAAERCVCSSLRIRASTPNTLNAELLNRASQAGRRRDLARRQRREDAPRRARRRRPQRRRLHRPQEDRGELSLRESPTSTCRSRRARIACPCSGCWRTSKGSPPASSRFSSRGSSPTRVSRSGLRWYVPPLSRHRLIFHVIYRPTLVNSGFERRLRGG